MLQHLAAFLTRTEVWVGALALAAFLVLYWAIRGAPIGQAAREDADDEEVSAGYRDRVVAAVVVGLLLVLAGAYVAVDEGVIWSIPVFALGFGIVLTLAGLNRRYRHGSPTLRRAVEFSNTALTVSLVAGILIVVNVMAFRYGGRAIDFTRERTYTLESGTLNLLKSLPKPVTFTVFFGNSQRAVRELDRVQQLLELYKAANPRKVTVVYLDPFRDLDKYEALVKRVPDIAVTQGGGMLIEYGEGEGAERTVVRNNELFELPRPGRSAEAERFETVFKGEDAVTSALTRLEQGTKPKVGFLTGHGEPSVDELDPRRGGLGLFKSRLTTVGSEVMELNLLRDEIPKDLALLIVVGGKSPLKTEEAGKVKNYLDTGGALMVLQGNQETSGLEELLKSNNVEIGSGIILEPRFCLNGRPPFIYVGAFGEVRHPIVEPLLNRPVLMPNSAPLRLPGTGSGPAGNPRVIAVPILQSSKESWAETDLKNPRPKLDPGRDTPGPLTVAAAVSERARAGEMRDDKPRLVIFSSQYMALNPFLEAEPTNLDVLMNAVNWLRGRPELTGIAPKTHVSLTLSSDPILRARLILVPTVMAVLVIVGLGITTYVARRE